MGYQQQTPEGLTVWSRSLSLSALEREKGTDTCVEYQLEIWNVKNVLLGQELFVYSTFSKCMCIVEEMLPKML